MYNPLHAAQRLSRRARITIACVSLCLATLGAWAATNALSRSAEPLSLRSAASPSWASASLASTATTSAAAAPPSLVTTTGGASMLRPAPKKASTPQTPPAPAATLPSSKPFDSSRAMASVRWLEDFGVRVAGSVAERNAAEAIAGRLRALGYASAITPVTLDNGRTSVNVHALSRGSSKRTIVLGAHIDSKAPSPGANDNATGVAAVLEIARLLAAKSAVASVEFVFFGAEETIDKNPDHHHYGSRAYVASMSGSERANTAGMVSVDMIGYGPDFVVRSMERGPQSLVRLMLARSKSSGAGLTYLKDPGKTGWSDHEAFELAGIPAAWIEWRDDPVYHTARDTSAHVKSARVAAAGGLVLELVRSLTEKDLEDLVRR